MRYDSALWIPAAEVSDRSVGEIAALRAQPAAGFSAVGQTVLAGVEATLRNAADQLRQEGFAGVERRRSANSAAPLLTQIALQLQALGEVGGEDDPVGIEIQRLSATEHGRERCILGWSERNLALEYDLILAELVRRGGRDGLG
jgi:hypothetical protein